MARRSGDVPCDGDAGAFRRARARGDPVRRDSRGGGGCALTVTGGTGTGHAGGTYGHGDVTFLD
ncbi:hypothetical protein [Streptomyces globisporus]|uniref:hypothetical protein n=1 Tax=Streptomyces globisporus TaxID=1908 RepID=UPI0004C5C0EE|nr:hypothetical protein [Streptomyces globisporus]